MNKLITGLALIAFASLPGTALASGVRALPPQAEVTASQPVAPPATAGQTATEVNDYAAREAANPALGEFAGGSYGYYVGGGAVTVVLIVLLVLILL